MRQPLIKDLARGLGAVASKRLGVVLGLWGEAGIGKTWTAQAVLRALPCPYLSVPATASGALIASALPGPSASWAQAARARLAQSERLDPQALSTLLADLAPFVLHLEDLHEVDTAAPLAEIEQLAQTVKQTRGVGLLITS